MSIITIRSWFEHRGCQAVLGAVAVLLGLAMVISLANIGGGMRQGPAEAARPLVEVEGVTITSADYGAAQQKAPTRATDAAGRLAEVGQIIDRLVGDLALKKLADKYGVKVGDEQLKAKIKEDAEGQLLQLRFQMMQAKMLTMKATDKDFEDAFKKALKTSPAEYKAKYIAEQEAKLKDAQTRSELEKAALPVALMEALSSKSSYSLEDLKKTYDTYTVNRLAFVKPGRTAEANKADAEKALAELKAGKPFAEVCKTYTGQPAPSPSPYTRGIIDADPSLKPIQNLKPNEYIEITESSGSPVIYGLVKFEQNLPPDFEKTKETLLKNMKMEKARTDLLDEIKPYQDGTKLKWKDETMKLVYAAYQATGINRSKLKKADLEALLAKIEAAYQKAPEEQIAMAQQVTFDEIFRLSTSDQQKDLARKRADIITATLDYLESSTLRLDLVSLYQELGDKDQALAELETAARNVTGGFDSQAQAEVTTLENKAFAMERSGFFNKEQGDQIRAIILQWRKDKQKYDDDEKEMKRVEAEEKKKADQEEKEMEARENKLAEKEKKEEAGAGAAKPSAGAGSEAFKPGAPKPAVPAGAGAAKGGK